MADFHQNGIVSTLHNLSTQSTEALEAQLVKFSQTRPIGLILPSLFSELEGPALENIVQTIAQVPYINEIVILKGGKGAESIRSRARRSQSRPRTS